MKQIALALHNYADAHSRSTDPNQSNNRFPAGTIANPSLPPEQRLSWIGEVWPYVEEAQGYHGLDTKTRWDAPANLPIVQKPMPVFRCPDWDREGTPSPAYVTPYIGVAGVGFDAALLPTQDRRAGIFGYDRQTTFGDIKDGMSHTMMILESARDHCPWAQGGPATVRGLDPGDSPYLGTGRPFGGTHFEENTLFHHGRAVGCNAAMADGSVRYLNNDIAPPVLEALATIAGGEHVDNEW